MSDNQGDNPNDEMTPEQKLLLEQWKTASQLHRHMDNMAWQRFNYFIATNGVLLAALGAIAASDTFNENPRPLLLLVVSVILCFSGMVISLIWLLIQKRGQGYHLYRAEQAKQTERDLKIKGKQVLTLYSRGLNKWLKCLEDETSDEESSKDDNCDTVKGSFPAKLKGYFTITQPGQWRTHSLIRVVAGFFALLWLTLLFVFIYFISGHLIVGFYLQVWN